MKNNFFGIEDFDIKIYQQLIKDFLPENIIDSHIHLWKKENIIEKKMTPYNPFVDFECFPEFTINGLEKVATKIFQGKKYEGIFFGNPFKEIDIDGVNKYLLELGAKGYQVLYIPTYDDNLENQIFKEISKLKSFLGFKPYPKLSNKIGGEVGIKDFLNSSVLEYANKENLAVMLHLPRKKRLADENNIMELKDITKKYPNVNFLLAHSGRSYCLCDITDAIKELRGIDNLIFEISFINDWEIFEIILKNVSHDKIIYGSDMPVSILKGKNICINNKHYFATKKPFKWSISNECLNLGFTFFIYEQTLELFKALRKINLFKDTIIENIFYRNIKNILNIIL